MGSFFLVQEIGGEGTEEEEYGFREIRVGFVQEAEEGFGASMFRVQSEST